MSDGSETEYQSRRAENTKILLRLIAAIATVNTAMMLRNGGLISTAFHLSCYASLFGMYTKTMAGESIGLQLIDLPKVSAHPDAKPAEVELGRLFKSNVQKNTNPRFVWALTSVIIGTLLATKGTHDAISTLIAGTPLATIGANDAMSTLGIVAVAALAIQLITEFAIMIRTDIGIDKIVESIQKMSLSLRRQASHIANNDDK